MRRIVLGTGVLTWMRHERVGDRYGAVYLVPDGVTSLMPDDPGPTRFREEPAGRATLVATVTDARDSTHIGDLFHGVFPSRPEVGERIVLGTGTLFFEDDHGGQRVVGLRPDDGRATLWLDIRALYRAHEQLVEFAAEIGTETK